MPFLTLAVAVPLAGAAVIALLPARASRTPQRLALGASALSLAAIAATWLRYDSGTGLQLVEEAEWIPTLGVAWRLAVDGMSLVLAAMACVLFLAALGRRHKPLLFAVPLGIVLVYSFATRSRTGRTRSGWPGASSASAGSSPRSAAGSSSL